MGARWGEGGEGWEVTGASGGGEVEGGGLGGEVGWANLGGTGGVDQMEWAS